MGQNPINLAVRFVLEVLALIATGYWGWANHAGTIRYIATIGAPVLVAVLWGTLRVPYESPSGHAPIAVPGLVRLVFEAAVFSFAVWGLLTSGALVPASLLGSAALIHYAVSYDRVWQLVTR